MKMNKNVKVGLGVTIFCCLIISIFAFSDKSAKIGNNIDQELAEQYPDKAVDPPVTEEPEIEDEYVEPSYTEPTGDFEEAKEMIDNLCMSALPGDGTIEYTSHYSEEDKTLALGFKVNILDSTLYSQMEIDSMLAEYDIINIYSELNRQAENLLQTYGVTDVTVNTCIFDANLVPVKYIY